MQPETSEHILTIQYLDVENSVKFTNFKTFVKFNKIHYHSVQCTMVNIQAMTYVDTTVECC